MNENSFGLKEIPIPIHEPDPLQPLIPAPNVPDDISPENDDDNLIVDKFEIKLRIEVW